jgi:hypothetical protein
MLGLGCACHLGWLTLLTGASTLVALLVADEWLRREAVARGR